MSQFQIFRETKESELQNLLRAKRDLENKLTKVGSTMLEDIERASRLEASAGKSRRISVTVFQIILFCTVAVLLY